MSGAAVDALANARRTVLHAYGTMVGIGMAMKSERNLNASFEVRQAWADILLDAADQLLAPLLPDSSVQGKEPGP